MLRGLSIAASGLSAAQRGLDVTAHNIANANTVGYTRQQIVQVANAPSLDGVPLQGLIDINSSIMQGLQGAAKKVA